MRLACLCDGSAGPYFAISMKLRDPKWLGSAEDAVQIAATFDAASVYIIDVSVGQTSTKAQPVYGRMFQTSFSDRIRNEASIKTMAIGNIYEADHANSILMAGRPGLVCLARPHQSDPYWTSREAARIGDRREGWPKPHEVGRDQTWRLADRAAEMEAKV